MSEKSIVIVGAGMAGLSAGCYARMSGYRATVLEAHSVPGGLCTAWTRKGYTFDISMHWLTGSKSGAFHQMWQELGVMDNRRFHYHSEMCTVESGSRRLSFCTDAQRLEAQMFALSPADAALTREFVRVVCGPNMMAASDLKPTELTGLFDNLRVMLIILPLMGTFRKYGKTTIQEFAGRFQNPFLREAVRMFIDGPGWPMPRFPMVALTGFLKSAVSEAGVPVGGSQQVAFAIAERFKELGGELRLKTRVADVSIDNGRAVGVKLSDGTEIKADEVIWAADGHTLIFDILGGRYVDSRIRTMYEKWIPVRPVVHVCLGVNREMSAEPARLTWELEKPINVAGEERKWLSVIHHSFDQTMAPAGKAAVEVWYPCQCEYWQGLAKDRPRYDAEKERIADLTITELDRRWPGFRAQTEVVDVPTPTTYVRYTGNWQASPDGWYVTVDNMRTNPIRTLPQLGGLWMAGQWTAPFTGTVMAALTGRQVIELLCRQDRKRLIAARPSPRHLQPGGVDSLSP
ncbi:MAG TPA: NAD(P)/FAD-dependent oxidoreductase [bacterium]|nr:NAD(P)/FAD-dependent oxidoreductase [bacterium]